MGTRILANRGFTLVEVLVALLVLSTGLLSIAALNIAGLRASRAALMRTQAVALAADIADRLRANAQTPDGYNCAGRCEPGAGGDAIAVADLDAWRNAVAATLPEGVGAITYEAATAGMTRAYTVRVSWTTSGAMAASSYQLRVEL
jgi:type IV pilus assembly protein PilV